MLNVKQVSGAATCTTAELHVYANGSTGSDANDGLTVGAPKLTLQAVLSLLPALIKHNTCVHLAGVFSEPGSCYVRSDQIQGSLPANATPILLIDGGDTVTDTGGGAKITTGGTARTLVVNLAGWVVDAYAGYFAKMTSGVRDGQIRTIQGNTSDTITLQKDLTGAPGIGDTFIICRPSTEIAATAAVGGISTANFGNCQIQRLYLSGTKATITATGPRTIVAQSLIINSSSSSALYCTQGASVTSVARITNPTTFVTDTTTYAGGVSSLAGTVNLYGANQIQLNSFFAAYLKIQASKLVQFSNGSRVNGKVELYNSAEMNWPYGIGGTAAGYPDPYISNSAGVGLLVKNSKVSLAGIAINSSASHGIEVDGGMVFLQASVSGAANVGAGVYAHSGSVVHIKNGSPPTLTGTVGDLAVSNPAAQESTWAAIDAGTPVAIAAEMTMAKEVA